VADDRLNFKVKSRIGFVVLSESREGIVTFKVKSRIGMRVKGR
jgi:hypothetical protein